MFFLPEAVRWWQLCGRQICCKFGTQRKSTNWLINRGYSRYFLVSLRAVPEIILGGHIFFQTSPPPGHTWSQSPPRPPGHVSALINAPHYGSNMPWPPGQVTPPPPTPRTHCQQNTLPPTGQKSVCGPPPHRIISGTALSELLPPGLGLHLMTAGQLTCHNVRFIPMSLWPAPWVIGTDSLCLSVPAFSVTKNPVGAPGSEIWSPVCFCHLMGCCFTPVSCLPSGPYPETFEGLDDLPSPGIAEGPHFAGNCNPFPENSGIECRKSALSRSIITKFPRGGYSWTPLMANPFGARIMMFEKVHLVINMTPLIQRLGTGLTDMFTGMAVSEQKERKK